MAYSEKQKEATARYRAKVGRAQVCIDLNMCDRDTWKAYATAQGLTLPAMVRACVARCMQEDGYTATPDRCTATHDSHVHSDQQEAQTQTNENNESI